MAALSRRGLLRGLAALAAAPIVAKVLPGPAPAALTLTTWSNEGLFGISPATYELWRGNNPGHIEPLTKERFQQAFKRIELGCLYGGGAA